MAAKKKNASEDAESEIAHMREVCAKCQKDMFKMFDENTNHKRMCNGTECRDKFKDGSLCRVCVYFTMRDECPKDRACEVCNTKSVSDKDFVMECIVNPIGCRVCNWCSKNHPTTCSNQSLFRKKTDCHLSNNEILTARITRAEKLQLLIMQTKRNRNRPWR